MKIVHCGISSCEDTHRLLGVCVFTIGFDQCVVDKFVGTKTFVVQLILL